MKRAGETLFDTKKIDVTGEWARALHLWSALELLEYFKPVHPPSPKAI